MTMSDLEEAIEKAYWEMKARTDPTQQTWRDSHGLRGIGPQSERDAFKIVVRGLLSKFEDDGK